MAGEPREFGPYQLVRRLGVGGMAETFEATRAGTGGFEQRVCLKRVLPAFSEDEEFVARFQREARLAAQLRHTNVVGVIDVGNVDGVHYMALELVDGVDLRSFLRSSPGEKLPAETVTLIAMDLAHALEHAHASLVHRDISPSNILLSRSGEAKLADFGIAKALDDAKATASRSARGKVPYMSPEHMRAEAVDGRTDLFSLGVVLFESLAGARPFDGAHDVEIMQRILDGDRQSLGDVAPEAPRALREIVERLIEIDADARTPSAAVLIEELGVVAPAPSVRRALATTVEGHRGGPMARMHVRAREEERDTELSRPPALVAGHGEQAAIGVSGPPRRGRWLAAVLTMGMIVGLGAAVWQSRGPDAPGAGTLANSGATSETRTESESAAKSEAAPESASTVMTAAEPGSEPAPAALEPAAPSQPARARKGWVKVYVQPWGYVWIDGAYMGRAPVEARVRTGRHVVGAGREHATQTRVVHIGPGDRKEVEVELRE